MSDSSITPEQQEIVQTTPPSITDTDADDSDRDEAQKTHDPMTTGSHANGYGESTDLSGTEYDETPVTEDNIIYEVNSTSDLHGEENAREALAKTARSTYYPRSLGTDVLVETAGITGAMPRGAADTYGNTELYIDSTSNEGAPIIQVDPTKSIVTPTFSPQNDDMEDGQGRHLSQSVCHPSKLIRDNSDSTLQPIQASKITMTPNMRPVDEEPEEVGDHDLHNGDVKVKDNQPVDETNVHENDDQINQSATADESEVSLGSRPVARNTSEAPLSPSLRVMTPLDDNTQHTQDSNIVIAPHGTIVYQPDAFIHAPPTFQHHGSFGYTAVHMPVLQQNVHHPPTQMTTTAAPMQATGGRRKITLRLEEDIKETSRRGSFFFRRRSHRATQSMGDSFTFDEHGTDHGTMTVSWFDGTTSSELQEHVRKSVIRKMKLDKSTRLSDMRIMDQSVHPPEEIVLSPYIPDGSSFLLRFSTRTSDNVQPSRILDRRVSEMSAPESPSAAPSSPYPSNADLNRLNAQLLSGKLGALTSPIQIQSERRKSALKQALQSTDIDNRVTTEGDEAVTVITKKTDDADNDSKASDDNEDEVMGYNPEDQIEMRLRQLADLLISDRKQRRSQRQKKEKRQVVFVIANYFVLFLSLIAISAELSARFPKWVSWMETQLESVQKCSTDQETLFECVSKGEFTGLVASVILWLSRSAATKKFFLFGFESPKKLWTVVYESLVTAICWGSSYLFIRRGMNPDTRNGFVGKYWKDAVYGSLAGFNAAFMKHVLRNLIPQEALEDALQERKLKILSWLPSFHP